MNLEVHYYRDRTGWWCARVEWGFAPVRMEWVKSPFANLGHAMLYLAQPIAKLIQREQKEKPNDGLGATAVQ